MESHRVLAVFIGLFLLCASLGIAMPRLWSVEPTEARRERWRDLSMASVVEVRDGSRSVLRGELQQSLATPGTRDLLKVAQLTSDEDDAVGKAEIELVRQANGVLVQELEVDVDGLASHALYTVYVDGRAAGAFRTNGRGGAELEQYGRVHPMMAARGAD